MCAKGAMCASTPRSERQRHTQAMQEVPCSWSKGVSKAGTSLQRDMLVSSNTTAQNDSFRFALLGEKKG